jgi:peptide/nickel transport system substrate-binding protein
MPVARCSALAFAIAFVCGCASTSAPPANVEAGYLRIGFHSEPHTLSPILPQHVEEFALARFFSDVLTSYDERGRLVPMLAAAVPTGENGGISADQRTLVYHLRRNVRWHDGVPFTSADVAFTWHAVMNPANDVVSRDGYELVDRVDTPDRYTVRFHLKHPFAPIVGELFGDGDSPYGMLPAHLLAKYRTLNDVPFNAAPVGTGPFIVKKWLRGDRIELVANPAYYLGKPGLARITIYFIGDENTLVSRLRAHEIDWMDEAGPYTIPVLQTIDGIRIERVDQNQWFGLMFNLRRTSVAGIHLRRAIAASLDKERLARELTFGTADPATVDLPSFLWAYPQGIRTVVYDPALARRELALAPRRSGPLELAFDESSGTTREAALQIESELRGAGIPIQLRPYPPETFLGSYSDGGIETTGKFDIALARLLWGPDPDNSGEFGCAAIPPGGYNLMGYCNPAMERWQREALGSVDHTVRKRAYAHIEALVASDLPIVPLWWPRAVEAVDTRLEGFRPSSLMTTWNAYQWRLRNTAAGPG